MYLLQNKIHFNGLLKENKEKGEKKLKKDKEINKFETQIIIKVHRRWKN